MSFNSPWLLWFLFAAALPIIIHLINRWRHKSVKWAAMDFVLRATKETKGVKKLLHYIILALRALAIIVLILAFARPLMGDFFGWGQADAKDVLLVLDRSASMNARPDKNSPLISAVPSLVNTTSKQLSDSRLALLESTNGQTIQIPEPQTLADLSMTKATDSGADIPSLLEKTIPYLETCSTGNPEIWIASDMQLTSWNPESPVWAQVRERFNAMPIPPTLRIMALRDRPASNHSITLKSLQKQKDKLLLEIEILRHGDICDVNETLPLITSIDNVSTSSDISLVGHSVTLQKEIPLPEGKNSGFGYLALPNDDSPSDDIVYFTFTKKHTAQIAVNGPNNAITKLLANMAAPPGLNNKKSIQYNTSKFKDLHLDDKSLVIWSGNLPAADEEKIVRDYLEQGGQILFLPNDSASASTTSFLGISWKAMEQTAKDEHFQISNWERKNGSLKDGADKTPIPASKLQAIKRKCFNGKYSTLATWDDDECAIAQIRVGAGQAIFLSTLPKYAWSNLADGHLLLPLVFRMAEEGAIRFETPNHLEVNAANLPKSTTDTPIRLDHAQEHRSGSLPTAQAGVYKLGSQIFAVNRPTSEDDIEQITDEKVLSLLPDATISTMHSNHENSSLVREAWYIFLYLMLFSLLLEAFLCLPKKQTKPFSRL